MSNFEFIPKKTTKATLRSTLIKKRQEIHSNLSDIQKNTFYHRIERLIHTHHPYCIGFYWPLSGEFDVKPLIKTWLDKNALYKAALPVVDDMNGPLQFYEWRSESVMMLGKFNVSIPIERKLAIPDLLLIPCIGFDNKGYRLGYGGGYYDRTLASLKIKPITVGIAYEETRVSILPIEKYDIALDFILTENALYQTTYQE